MGGYRNNHVITKPRCIKQASKWPSKQQLKNIRKPSKILEMLDNLTVERFEKERTSDILHWILVGS